MRNTEADKATGGVAILEGSSEEVEGGEGEREGRRRAATREESGEVRMSVMAGAPSVLTRRRHHFLLVAAVVVAMVVTPGPALASRPPSLPTRPPSPLTHPPHRLPPHSPQRLPPHSPQHLPPHSPQRLPPHSPQRLPPHSPQRLPPHSPRRLPPHSPQRLPPHSPQRLPPHSPQHLPPHSPQRLPPHSPQRLPPHSPQHLPPHSPQRLPPHSPQRLPPHSPQRLPPHSPQRLPPHSPQRLPPHSPQRLPPHSPQHLPPHSPQRLPPHSPQRLPPHSPQRLPPHSPQRLPPHSPQRLPPHSPQHLPPHSLLQRWPQKAVAGMRLRRVRSALAPPTVTSLRPPDRSLSGQRQAGRTTGGVGSGGSSGSSGPPVVASQSPSSASTPSHHVYHDRHHNRRGPMAPVATAASGSRSRGGEQPTSRQGTSGTPAEGGEGIHIFGQESYSGRDSRHQHHEEATGLAQGNRDSTTWNGDLVIESRKAQKTDNESQAKSGESESGKHESEWQGGELSGNRRVLDWDSDDLQGGRRDGHGWARVEESVWREREGSPVMEEQWWMESGVGGGVWVEEGAAEGRGRRGQSTPRNDTYGHAITEDLAHLSSGHPQLWRPRGGGGGGGGLLSPPLAGRRRNQATRNRHVWVLEEVEEEEAEGEKEESKEVRMSVENIPQVANADFVNAYLHAAQHYQESKREEQMQPRGGASSYPSSSSSPSLSHPSILGSSYYPPSTSLSSSPPHSSSSATYSSSSNLRDDLSPFHQSLAPQQPRPSNGQDDEYEPEDYTNYHEYDHHSRSILPQDNTWHPRTSQGQQSNAATHWDQQQGDLGIRRPTKVNTRHNDFSFSDDEMEAGENGYPGEERVGPDFKVSGSSPSASPDGEGEDEREINGAAEDGEEQNQRRNRKKGRRNKGKGRRDRERGRKNRRGRNKGGRRWRQGRKQSTTPIPFSPSSSTTTTVDNEAQAPASTTFTLDTPLERFLSTEIPVGMPQSSPQPAVDLSTPQAPIPPQTLTTSTTATLLPAAPSAVPTTPSRAVPSQTTVTTPQVTTHILPQGSPRTLDGKTALVSEITVTVMETRTDEYDDITVIENLRPARRRPNLQGKGHENNNRGHRGEDRPREGINNEDGSERDPVKTEVEVPTEKTNFSREQQRDEYRFPVKGILIISGLMGALAVFTLVVLISYAVIKCSKKPAVNNYKVSEQKNEVPS